MSHFDDVGAALKQINPRPLLTLIQATHERGGTVWLCGNGGSFAVAQHWACDFVKAAEIRAAALGANGALLTAYANDVAYEHALAQELGRFARPHDLLIALSCSGTSPNIANAIGQAREIGMPAALITGWRYPRNLLVAVTLVVPSSDYGIIEDCFSAIGHWLTKELAT